MAASVAPSGMPEKSTVTMLPVMKAPLKDSFKGQRNHLSVSICAPGSDGNRLG